MKNFIRKWIVGALLLCSAITAPWVALAAYNILQNPNGSTCFVDSAIGNAAMCFFEARVTRQTNPQGVGPELWTFDQKEYTVYLADLGTASSALFAVPITGIVSSVSVTWGATLGAANAVMGMWRITAAQIAALPSAAFNTPALVTAFSLTAPTTGANGGRVTDDEIGLTVGMGDVIAIDTNGGPNNVVPGYITVTIKAR